MGFAVAEDQEFTLPPLEERPLVTFALFASNQEKYIREAVEGAFAQTYEPLEIILSDDCSTDRTFEIMEEMAKGYRGPNRVRTIRNKKNMGIAQHVHKVDLEANGFLIIHAAGDDISLPERTNALVNAWTSFEERPSVLVSNAYRIDSSGLVEGLLVNGDQKTRKLNPKDHGFSAVLGCSLAVSKSLFYTFDSIDERIIAEDVVLYRRAELLNGIFYLADPLVKWRRHTGSITHSGKGSREKYLQWEKRWATDTRLRIQQTKRDRLKLNLSGSSYSDEYERYIQLKLASLEGNILSSALKAIKCVLKKDINLLQAREIFKIILTRMRLMSTQ